MQLIVDTQAILWFQASDPKLSDQAKNLILDNGNDCFISMASLWEIAIKINLKKLTIGMPFKNLYGYLINNGFNVLNINFYHLESLAILENHHKDPFDRLLIAQAISENMTIISTDRVFKSYPIKVAW